MPDLLRVVAVATLFPVLALIVGGIVAAVRPPGPRTRSVVQHVAAGVVFAAVAGELLPAATAAHDPVGVAVGFAAGIALMLAVRRWSESRAEAGGADQNRLLVTVGIDIVVDGLLIGIGFAAGAETGVLVTVALTLEVLFLGLATAASLANAGADRRRVVAATVGLAILLAASATAGAWLLGGIGDGPFDAMLGFGSAALLYLVTEELLVEAHEVPETPATTAAFFAGFLALLVIEMVAVA